MSITGKELASKLNLSEAAVSMALRNKQGVSTQTRLMVLAAADKYGYDFSKRTRTVVRTRYITFVIYKRQGAVVGDTPFFSELLEGVEASCAAEQYKLQIANIHRGEDVERKVNEIISSDCAGIILLGTEMQMEDFHFFNDLPIPLVILDVYLDFIRHDYILINNIQGALLATDYLISQTKKQPGHLRSSYSIGNFDERTDGFYKAVRHHGMSTSRSIVHMLTPSIEGAYADMLELLENGEELAPCYFADNDWIAIGAMKAFQKKGFRVPEDIAVIGFDNVPMAAYLEPALTTVHVPKKHMGDMAVKRLIEIMGVKNHSHVKIEIATQLIKRQSV